MDTGMDTGTGGRTMEIREQIADIVYCNVPANYDGSNPEQVKEVCEKVADEVLKLLASHNIEEPKYCNCKEPNLEYVRGYQICKGCHKEYLPPQNPIEEPDDLTAAYMCGFEKGKDSMKNPIDECPSIAMSHLIKCDKCREKYGIAKKPFPEDLVRGVLVKVYKWARQDSDVSSCCIDKALSEIKKLCQL